MASTRLANRLITFAGAACLVAGAAIVALYAVFRLYSS